MPTTAIVEQRYAWAFMGNESSGAVRRARPVIESREDRRWALEWPTKRVGREASRAHPHPVATVKMFAFVVPSLLVQSLPLADLLVAIGVAIHSQPASIGHSWKDRFDYGGDGVRGTRRSRAPDPCRSRAGS